MRSAPIVAALALSFSAFPAVVTVRVIDRTDFENGKSFGAAGPYERIAAKAYFAVDPAAEANRNITDLALAPRNEQGMVEFTADVVVIKPRESKLGNGTVLFDIPNRGGATYRSFNVDDSFLYEHGFTIVDLGWQFDVPQGDNLLRLETPVARQNNAPIRGLVRGQFIPDKPATAFLVSDRNHRPYPAADMSDRAAKLLVRDDADSQPREIPRADWRFSDPSHVEYARGFEPGKIYEVIYTAENPPIAGLGPAAVRDFMSFLRYGGGNATAVLGDQRSFIKRSIAFGVSQSGRFLRTFLYDGFNGDEKGRKVFDGVWAHVAGAGRGSFNIRFAQPSRDGHPFLNLFYPTDLFPFTDLPETDPETGISAGLLDKLDPKLRPKIFYTNGSYEYWGRAGSLIHTTADGRKDAPLPEDTRIYFLAGTQHGANARVSRAVTQNLSNPADYRWALRALLLAMQAWVKDGSAPPESRYPRIDKDQLVTASAVQFPKIAGVIFPKTIGRAWRLDFSTEPPATGKAFPTLVSQVDRDGNESAGVRLPELAVPLATYTGWNLRTASQGAPDQLASMIGSFIPFAPTKSARLKTGDPRPSIEERYKGKDDYLSRLREASAVLARDRFLLESDIPAISAKAAARWDEVMTGSLNEQ
jgi:hypothetical protein